MLAVLVCILHLLSMADNDAQCFLLVAAAALLLDSTIGGKWPVLPLRILSFWSRDEL